MVSCKGSGSNPADKKLQTGTNGLTVTLLNKDMQKRIYEENNFYVRLQLHNEGFSDIKDGILVPQLERDIVELVSWDLPRDFSSGPENTVQFDLKGKTITNLKGDDQMVNLVLRPKKMDETRNKIESNLVFSACYPYSSTFSDTICIDTDPAGQSIAKKTCTAKDLTSSGQGAPIAITKIEQNIMPADSFDSVKVQFDIYAENKGKGYVVDYLQYKDICLGKDPRKEDYGTVWIDTVEFSDFAYTSGKAGGIDCYPNPMKMTKDGYHTQCTLIEGSTIPKSKLTFQTMLVVKLLYGYKETVGSQIEILNREQEMI